MTVLDIEKRLEEYGIKLPKAPKPVGNYKAFIITSGQAYISGQLPFEHNRLVYKGKLGDELNVDEGKKAARLCALNILSQIVKIEKTQHFIQLLKIEGFINSSPIFTEHVSVLDEASNLFSYILQHKAGHVRSVVGCSSLPLNAPVEILATIEINQP